MFHFFDSKSKKLWTPSKILTALWVDAKDSSTITLNGSNVSQWSDKSGNNRHLTQGTAVNQPTFVTEAVRFALGQFIGTAGFGTATQRSVFSVNTYDTASSIYQYVWEQGSASVTSGSGLIPRARDAFADWVTGDVVAFGNGFEAGRAPRFIAPRTQSSGSNIYGVSLGSQENTVRINSVALSARVQGAANFAANASNFNISRVTQSLIGDVAELIYIDGAISTNDRQKLEGYLAHKWGITANLPADHPYKNKAPMV
jgi:hypothetical protein